MEQTLIREVLSTRLSALQNMGSNYLTPARLTSAPKQVQPFCKNNQILMLFFGVAAAPQQKRKVC